MPKLEIKYLATVSTDSNARCGKSKLELYSPGFSIALLSILPMWPRPQKSTIVTFSSRALLKVCSIFCSDGAIWPQLRTSM